MPLTDLNRCSHRAPARRWPRAGRVVAIALTLGVATWALAEPASTDDRSPVYPAATADVLFEHDRHADVACETCHPAAATSVRASDLLTPAMSACQSCHDLGDPARCELCHETYRRTAPRWPAGRDAQTPAAVGNPPSVGRTPPALSFSHRLHTEAGASCRQCHGDPASIGLPEASVCASCHVPGAPASSTCATCHPATPDGHLAPVGGVALVPRGDHGGPDHRGDIARDHDSAARLDASDCEACHRIEQCLDCHDGVLRPVAIHPNNYLVLHGVDAQLDPVACDDCHGARDFCVGCHARSRVTDAQRPPVGLSYHPAGFADQPTSPSFHADMASRDLQACVACHGEDTCMACHAGIDPHPPDFRSRCAAMAARNDTACVKCHGADVDRFVERCR